MVILQNLVDVSLSHAMRACRSSQKFGRRYGPCSPDLVGVADSWKHATPPHVLHTEFYRSRQIHMDVSKPPPQKKRGGGCGRPIPWVRGRSWHLETRAFPHLCHRTAPNLIALDQTRSLAGVPKFLGQWSPTHLWWGVTNPVEIRPSPTCHLAK